MKRSRAMLSTIIIVSALVLGGCGSGSSATAGVDKSELRAAAQLRFARDGYSVTQAEFQGTPGDKWYVIQLDDPADVVVSRGYDPGEGFFELPMRAYAEILRDGQLEDMHGVSTFILAYRDPKRSVIEIPFSVMRDWVRGRLSVGALRQQVKFSVLSAG